MANDHKRPLTHLFRPGSGRQPPFLAGRDAAMKKLNWLKGDLSQKRAPSEDAVIFGPRGNGKTVLVDAFLQQATDLPSVQILKLTANAVPDIPSLCRALRPGGMRGFGHALMRRLASMAAGAEAPAEKEAVHDVVSARLKAGNPVIVSLDEAHNLDPGVGAALIDATQLARREDLPLLLILSGTLGLKPLLSMMGVTFWNRCAKIPAGLLSDADTAAALAEPLKGYGVSFDGDALAHVVKRSNGYPYFIQLWGKALTQGVSENSGISMKEVDAAQHSFEEQKNAYYAEYYGELDRLNLLSAAEAVAALYDKPHELVSQTTIMNAITTVHGCQERDIQTTLDDLVKLGYIWGDPANGYACGVPSLMDYVRKCVDNRDHGRKALPEETSIPIADPMADGPS